MPVYIEEAIGSSSGRGAKAVDSLPDISTVKPGDIFILTADSGGYKSGDFIYVNVGTVAASPGTITKVAVADSDFRDHGTPSSQTLDYVGAVTTQPATPTAPIQTWFWDISVGKTIGSASDAGAALKFISSNGLVSRALLQRVWFDLSQLLWIGDPAQLSTQINVGTAIGDATLDTEAEVIAFLDANETAKDNVETALAGADTIVLFEIAGDDFYKITAYTPGTVAGTENQYALLGGGTAAFGGTAVLGAQTAKTSGLNVYLFDPIVETNEVIDWELKGITRLATNATKDIYTNSAQTQGIRITLSDPAGAAGNDWRFVRGVASGTPVVSRVVAGDEFRLDGTIAAGYLASELKALIDVLPQLSSVYFGGETGTTTLFDSLSTEQIFGDPLLEEDHFSGGADALDHSIVIDESNNEVLLYTLATETLGEVATLIENIEGLGYNYFGGADATTLAARPTPWTEPFDLITIIGDPLGLQVAQAAAEAAATRAETAETNAETAETNAETAETSAETAQTAAESAQATAETARTAAQTAQSGAETAETNAETAETNAETAETNAETARDRAEAAQSGAETALQSSGAALAFNDLWSGDIDITTANQWKALGTGAVPSNATWLIWNGGQASDGTNDGPAGLSTWINAAVWRALTADTVDTTPGDGTGMLMVDWIATNIGDGTPDFARRDAIIGRTSADIPLITSTNTGEDFYGASLKYITQAVTSGGGGSGASSFSELTGMIADNQAPALFTRDAELAAYAFLAGAIGVSDLPSDVQNAINAFTYTTASPHTLSYTEVDGGTSAVILSGLAALSGGAVFTGHARGLTPVVDDDFTTKAYVDSAVSGTTPPSPQSEEIYFGIIDDPANAGTVALNTLTMQDATVEGHNVTIGPSTDGDYFIFLVPEDHDILTLINTGINVDVLSTYAKALGVRTENNEDYDAYTLGPLNPGLTVNYRLTLQE